MIFDQSKMKHVNLMNLKGRHVVDKCFACNNLGEYCTSLLAAFLTTSLNWMKRYNKIQFSGLRDFRANSFMVFRRTSVYCLIVMYCIIRGRK